MIFFWRKTAREDFLEAIRPELRALKTPHPTDDLKKRILTSRDAGVRMILPGVPLSQRHSSRTILALAAAITLVTLVPIELRRAGSQTTDFVSPGFLGLAAQVKTLDVSLPRPAPVRVASPHRLRPLSLVFVRSVRDTSGRTTDSSSINLELRQDALDGTRAWRAVWLERLVIGQPTGQIRSETTYMAVADLRILRRDIHWAPYSRYQRINLHQHFSADSLTGRMFTEGPSIGAGRPIRRRLSPVVAPYLTETVATLLPMVVPLDRGWSGTSNLLGWAVRDDDVLLPVELRVEGEQVLSIPAGRFDCWRLSLRFPGREIDYWVRKSDGLGVRYLSRDPRTKGAREILLTRDD